MISEQVERYFALARERYNIFLKREAGEPPPWTYDEILQTYRFCNVFRETDKVTRWIKEHVRDPLSWDHNIVYAMTVSRFFNLPSTLEILEQYELFTKWDPHLMKSALYLKKPLITGAYMVKTPLRQPKLDGLISLLEPIWLERRQLYNYATTTNSMELTCQKLMEYPWIGPFMAYQICRDLVYTSALQDPVDYLRWAVPGPGALKGLRYLCSGRGDGPLTGEPLALLLELAELAQHDEYWPKTWPEMTVHDAQTWACEFSKYEKVRLGEGRPKQLFDGRG